MKKRLLFLTPQLPYPPVSGGVIKSYRLLRYFSERYDVDLACITRPGDEMNIQAFQAQVPLRTALFRQAKLPRTAWNYLRSWVHGVPLSVYRNRCTELRQRIEALARNADAIFVDHFLMYQYVPKWFKGRVILHEHNAEFLIWRRYASVESSLPRRLVAYMESLRIKSYEQRIVSESTRVLAAPNDIDALKRLGVPEDRFFETMHLGDDTLLSLPDPDFHPSKPHILFVGTLTWEPNADGLEWFLREVWPTLIERIPNARFSIVGDDPEKRISRLATKYPGVEALGRVEDLTPLYDTCQLFVAPLRFGGGIKVKVINAMYRGIPVITTSIGAEGLQVKHDTHLVIAENATDWVEGIIRLLGSESAWRAISTNSRTLARSLYTWERTLETAGRSIDG